MYTEEVDEAIQNAFRFIKAAEAWKVRCGEDRYALIRGTREGGALKRASLDLSASLAQMRKPFHRRTPKKESE